MGLLGPNGSGKTTILRILTGYLRPSAGTVRVAGFDVVRDGRAARERVGYVPEDAPLYPHMRVDEFLAFMGRLRGLDGRGAAAAPSTPLVERLALRPVCATPSSAGCRAATASASRSPRRVLHEPKLLVLDEPTNGLDPRQIIELRELIRALARATARSSSPRTSWRRSSGSPIASPSCSTDGCSPCGARPWIRRCRHRRPRGAVPRADRRQGGRMRPFAPSSTRRSARCSRRRSPMRDRGLPRASSATPSRSRCSDQAGDAGAHLLPGGDAAGPARAAA